MAKFLVVLMVLCVSMASGLPLENICPSSIFSYKGTLVNAFHRVRQNVTFEPLNHFLVDHSIICDPNEFQNKSNHLEALRTRNRYNRKFAEVYSERVLNSCTADEWDTWKRGVVDSVLNISKMLSKEKQVKCLSLFKETMKRGFFLLFNLNPFYNDRLQFLTEKDGVKPTKGELLAELKKTIEGLQIEEDSQTFAFRSHSIDEIYEKHMVLKEKFEFIREDSDVFQPTQRSRLFYDLILPFNNRKPAVGRCFKSEELPQFYKYHY